MRQRPPHGRQPSPHWLTIRAVGCLDELRGGCFAAFDASLARNKAANELRALPLAQFLEGEELRRWRKVRRTAPYEELRQFVDDVRSRVVGAAHFGRAHSSDESGDGPWFLWFVLGLRADGSHFYFWVGAREKGYRV